jgi:hypothetical protein
MHTSEHPQSEENVLSSQRSSARPEAIGVINMIAKGRGGSFGVLVDEVGLRKVFEKLPESARNLNTVLALIKTGFGREVMESEIYNLLNETDRVRALQHMALNGVMTLEELGSEKGKIFDEEI